MAIMKLGDALNYYRGIRQELIDQKKKVLIKKDSLEKLSKLGDDYSKEIATLELSMEGLKQQEEQNYEKLSELTGRYAAIWNAEVARQQADAGKEMAQEMVKIMEVARRIAKGDIVPSSDEQKLIEFSPELYQAAKNMAALNEMKEHKKHDSLWKDEEEPKEYDPEGKAENAEVSVDTGNSIQITSEIAVAEGGAQE